MKSPGVQVLPQCSIAEEASGAAEAEEEEEEDASPLQAASTPPKPSGLFGRTQQVKAQPPQVLSPGVTCMASLVDLTLPADRKTCEASSKQAVAHMYDAAFLRQCCSCTW